MFGARRAAENFIREAIGNRNQRKALGEAKAVAVQVKSNVVS